MIEIITQLDSEGINLQETILNLKSQGYEWYYHLWLEHLIQMGRCEVILDILDIIRESLKETYKKCQK